MATWTFPAVDSMANALNLMATNSAFINFYDSAGTQVGPSQTGSASFAAAAVSGLISCRSFVSCTATGSMTLGTAILFTNAAATIGRFICSSGGAVDFVFAGGLNVATTDSIIVNSWTITVQTS